MEVRLKHTLSELAEICGASLEGDGSTEVVGPASLRDASDGEICFYDHPRHRADLLGSRAAAVVAPRSLELPRSDLPVLRCDDARLAFARIARCFAPSGPRLEPGIHATAVVDPGARLADDVAVGPLAVVGPSAELAAGVVVHAHAVIGAGVRIGPGSEIHAGVVLYRGVSIGARCIVHSGTVIGSDGYGYHPTPDGWLKVPQLGTVVVEDEVEIGACCAIDRGRFGATRIGRGAKLDNLIQVAHNVEIGEHVMLAAQVGIAGSTRIGSGAMLAGQVGVDGHVAVGERARLAGQAGVIGNVPAGADYLGYPARPKREALRNYAALQRLPQLAERVKDLERRIAELERASRGGDA